MSDYETARDQLISERDEALAKVETMRSAVDHFVERLRDSKEFWYQCGWGMEIFRRMSNCYAMLNGISEQEAETLLRKYGA